MKYFVVPAAAMLMVLTCIACGASEGDNSAVIPWAVTIGDYECQCGSVDELGMQSITSTGTLELYAATVELAVVTIMCGGVTTLELRYLGTNGDTIKLADTVGLGATANYLMSTQQLAVLYGGDKVALASK